MDLVKKRHGSADLHSPINPPPFRVDTVTSHHPLIALTERSSGSLEAVISVKGIRVKGRKGLVKTTIDF